MIKINETIKSIFRILVIALLIILCAIEAVKAYRLQQQVEAMQKLYWFQQRDPMRH